MKNTTTEFRLLNTLRNPQFHHVVWGIKPELFTDERQDIFSALRSTLKKYGNASTEAMEAVLGRELPSELDVSITVDPNPLIDDLARLYQKRIAVELADEFKRQSQLHEPDFKLIRNKLQESAIVREEDTTLTGGINQFLSQFHAKGNDTYRWLDTGITFLNNMLGGEWPRGELTVVTGQSGGGKTALMNTSALNMARLFKATGNSSAPGIFSIEMPKDQLVTRFLSDLTGINSSALRTGRYPSRPFNDEERRLIQAKINELEQLPIFVTDNEYMTADWVVAQGKILHRKFGVECFFIDYFQLLKYEGENKHYGLSESGRTIRRFAKSANVAVIALAQLNGDGKIRDSSDIERDAGAWINISIDRDTMDDSGICAAQFEVIKNRHGSVGKYTGLFDSKHVRFIDR